MTDLIQYSAACQKIKTVNAKTGATTTRLMRAKEFKDAFKAKNPDASNREIKKEFLAYYRTHSQASTAALAAKMTEGILGVESFSVNADGDKLRVTFVDLSAQESESPDIQEQLDKLSPDELKTIMEYLASKVTK